MIKVKKIEENMEFESVLNEETKFVTDSLSEPFVKNLKKSKKKKKREKYLLKLAR